MDAEGGEKIDTMERLYGTLLEDARARGILSDKYYFLGDDVLVTFKRFQGFDSETVFPGTRLEQAYLIWRQCPRHTLNAVARTLGFEIPASPMLLGQAVLVFGDD